MRFTWDEEKDHENIRKHGISFEIAMEVFHDPLCLTIEDQTVDHEQRLWTIGSIENHVTLVVVHILFDEVGEEIIRIISARKATPRERNYYEE